MALAGLTFMTYKNMHGDKIAERIAAQKEAMRQARKEMEEAEDEHHELSLIHISRVCGSRFDIQPRMLDNLHKG